MAIHYTCRCGAHIRMPSNVAGKKARCNSCGFIFTVPQPESSGGAAGPDAGSPASIPLEPRAKPESLEPSRPTGESSGDIGDWLGEFAEQENTAASTGPPTSTSAAGGVAPEEPAAAAVPSGSLLDFADDDDDDILAPATRRPERPLEPSTQSLENDARSGIIAPTQSYWANLAGSFLFFLDAGSLVTFVIIVLINLWTIPLRFAGVIGLIGTLVIAGYLCTFYMAVIKETAAGEDELPNVWIDDVWELISSLFKFLGTWACVLLPALLFAAAEFAYGNQVHWEAVKWLAIVGLFFWPVVILGVALGGSFYGLWPHVIVRTALVAPLPYLALCGVLLVAAGITTFPSTQLYADLVNSLSNRTNRSFLWPLILINSGLGVYAIIVAMRSVGLYYRHYKQRFPWVAE